MTALSLGFVLFVWLVRDITAGLRRGFEELKSRELALREARNDFRELEPTEKRIGQWVKRIQEGGDASAIALKVDRGFLSHDDESEEKPSMLRTILQMGDSAGLVLIVEGIETPEWERSLQELGYTLGQGFLYGKAVPVAEAKNLFFSDKPKDSQ